ncbi:ferredoxin reductase family protein [Desulfosoma caldarium]|uniref:Putative ferric reductase n=1 Tax=Desulfosoma caldarium TaxID=610254 RepID=A0A3N1UQQ6_9BACT|nr:ferredoxin reductase family protein [Desulfosoma caldarium]ROQ92078.1 putative ferric reductase [Desulfosoma caldarium]
MHGRASKVLLFLSGLGPAVLTAGWAWRTLPGLKDFGVASAAAAVSSLFAQNALVFLAILVILGSRARPVERVVGLDRMSRAHRPLAAVTLCCLLVHVGLQAIRFYSLGGASMVASALLSAELWEMTMGRLALLLLFLAAASAVVGRSGRVPFRFWKPVHLLTYAAVPLGLVHALVRGTTMADMPQVVVWGIVAMAFTGAGFMRLASVLGGRDRVLCRVERVVSETHDTVSVFLEMVKGAGRLAKRRPGQFALLRLPEGRGYSEPHPFTISNAPEDKTLRFTIKRSGRFTSKIHGLSAGDRVLCQGPYGVFCADALGRSSLALIAGGVGITPFFSLLRHMKATGLVVPTVLLWANKTSADIIGREELTAMSRTMPLRVVHVLSREKFLGDPSQDGLNVSYEQGHITAEILRRYLRSDHAFYLCGPPAMQAALLKAIRTVFGLKAKRVARELFFW